MKSEFDALVGQLEDLQKSLPADGGDEGDKKIEAAASGEDGKGADGAAAGGDAGGEGDEGAHKEPDGDEGAGDGDGDEGGEPMGKSFTLELEDGTKVEAFDASDILKSMHGRISAQAAEIEALTADRNNAYKVAEQSVGMLKALSGKVEALSKRVAELSGAGAGRKSVVNVAEKKDTTDLRKSQGDDQKITVGELMTKCEAAQKAGRLTALDVARTESALGRGLPVPADVMARLS